MEKERGRKFELVGDFSIDGLAKNREAIDFSIKEYQTAVDLAYEELNLLQQELGLNFEISVSGSVQDLDRLRLGVYDINYNSFSNVSEKKLAESTYREKSGRLPSDIDLLISLVDKNQEVNYKTIPEKFDSISRKVFYQTGILVEITWRGFGTYERTPINSLLDGQLAQRLHECADNE